MDSLIIKDIEQLYVSHRKAGKGRTEAIEQIRKEYADALQDEEDRFAILLGLSLALCKKKEMVETIGLETLREIEHFKMMDELDEAGFSYLKKAIRLLNDKTVYGDEAAYRKKSAFTLDWKIGDTFSHILTYPLAKELGIEGWHILLNKVGSYTDQFRASQQLVVVSLCPPDKIPTTREEFLKLGLLRMYKDSSEYLAQIEIKSKRAELGYDLTRIGCFPDIIFPDDSEKENPLVTMPLFGKLKKEDDFPKYENQVCLMYRSNSPLSPCGNEETGKRIEDILINNGMINLELT